MAIVRRCAAAEVLLSATKAQPAAPQPGPEAAAAAPVPHALHSLPAPTAVGQPDTSQPQAECGEPPPPLARPQSPEHAVVPPEPLEEPVPLLSYTGPSLQQHITQQFLARIAARRLPPLPACLAASGGAAGSASEATASSASRTPGSPQTRRPICVAAAWAAIEAAHEGADPGCGGSSLLDRLLSEADPSAPAGQKQGQGAGQPQRPGHDLCVEDLETLAGGEGRAQSASADWKELLAACGWLRREPLGHLELYLDWCLLQVPQMQPRGAADAAARLYRAPHLLAPSLGTAVGDARLAVRRQAGAWLRSGVAAALHHAAPRPPATAVALPSRVAAPQPGTDSASVSGRCAKSASVAAPANDMAFFMRVQAGPDKRPMTAATEQPVDTAAAPTPAAPLPAAQPLRMVPEAQRHPPLADEREAKVAAPASPTAPAAAQIAAVPPGAGGHRIEVAPPDCAAHLLLQLQADRAAILASLAETAAAAPARLAASHLCDAAPAEQLLARLCSSVDQRGIAAAGLADKRLAAQLVALSLIAQAACATLDAGPRAAHLFVRHMTAQLPSVAALVPRGAAALAAAHARAERRGGEDHPKQRALGELLARLRRELPPVRTLRDPHVKVL